MREDLYYKDAAGNIRQYSVWIEETTLVMEYGVLGGETNVATEEIPHGLAGRTQEEQILLRLKSRVNKKLDKGYVRCLETAKNGKVVNALGFQKPMLAMDKDVSHSFFVCFFPQIDEHQYLLDFEPP